MARDDLKAIIERGNKIPSPKSHIMKPGKAAPKEKVDRSAIVEQPKLRTAVNSHRTMRGIRK